MNLTDEQWNEWCDKGFIAPLIPEKERLPRITRGRLWRNPREALDGVFWKIEQLFAWLGNFRRLVI